MQYFYTKTIYNAQHLLRTRHAMPGGTMGGKSPFLKACCVVAIFRGLRHSGLGSWVGLPWKFAPYSLQVTNHCKSFTDIMSSYSCTCGYFLYSLSAFHWKRQQHFLALGNTNIFRFQLPKPALRLQESTSAAGSLRALWLTRCQQRHSFVSDLFVASSQTTCTMGCSPFLHRCFEEGVGRLGLSVLLSNGENIDETETVCSQHCTMKVDKNYWTKAGTQEGQTGHKKKLLHLLEEDARRGSVISIPGGFQNSIRQNMPSNLTQFRS